VTPQQWRRAKELFEEALEHEPQTRAAFLQNACGDDEILRAEVESLIAEEERVGDFMDAPIAALPGSDAQDGFTPAP
jgi:eukaryotic-like serine/threonine-protein kinase